MTEIATVAVIAGLALVVHAALAVYLYRSLSDPTTESTESAPESRQCSGELPRAHEHETGSPQPTKSGHTSADPPAERTEPRSESIQCPVCGVPNDPGFQFCRRCVSELSGGSRAGGPPDRSSLG